MGLSYVVCFLLKIVTRRHLFLRQILYKNSELTIYDYEFAVIFLDGCFM